MIKEIIKDGLHIYPETEQESDAIKFILKSLEEEDFSFFSLHPSAEDYKE